MSLSAKNLGNRPTKDTPSWTSNAVIMQTSATNCGMENDLASARPAKVWRWYERDQEVSFANIRQVCIDRQGRRMATWSACSYSQQPMPGHLHPAR
mmetsp:Transcript_41534/g.104373  ORF Transcript_41534/g.104373 Transcript_41534/m.104373 type:complete len:96 (+) Transcript_41534:656-943(+)